MTARFRKKDDTVEAGVRRIALVEIDRAIASIDAVDRTAERKVHDIRQQCKKLRALIRLVRPALDGFDLLDAEFRDIARGLSGARDAKVTIETFDLLTRTGGKRLDGVDIATIRRRLEVALRRRADPGDKLHICRARLVEARAHAMHWTLAETDWAAIAGGLARTYRRARRAMAAAAIQNDPHVSHVWRKHAKYHWHHVRLLQAIQPRRLRDRAKEADKLAELLGQHHDIDIFLAALARAPVRFGGSESVATLAAIARKRSARLDKRAQRLGARLFGEKPGRLAARWGGWWRAWRAG